MMIGRSVYFERTHALALSERIMNTAPLFPSRLSLQSPARASLTELLNQHLADLTDLVSQLNNAHWNVRGAHFHSLHKAFEEVAGMVESEIDELAERITALGGVAQGSIRQAAQASRLQPWPTGAQGFELVAAMADRTAAAANAVRTDIDRAAALGDAGTADLLTGLGRALDKAVWLLDAHLSAGH